MELNIFETDDIRRKWIHLRCTKLQDQLVVDKFRGELLNLFPKISKLVRWFCGAITNSVLEMIIFLVMYIFVPRTRIPKFKKISSRKMLNTYRYHLTRGGTWKYAHVMEQQCPYEANILRDTHKCVKNVWCMCKFARKFQEHVNHNVGYWIVRWSNNLISLLYVKLHEIPISLGAVRCNKLQRNRKIS
jgi:hypothetical protein